MNSSPNPKPAEAGNALKAIAIIVFLVGCVAALASFQNQAREAREAEERRVYRVVYVIMHRSEDADLHHSAFTARGVELVLSGRCSIADLSDNDGFVRSGNRPGSYFTYCSQSRPFDRVYFNP